MVGEYSRVASATAEPSATSRLDSIVADATGRKKFMPTVGLWSLRIKWRHFAPLRLARMSLLIQAVALAKAQRRKGRKGKILATVGLNSQRPLFVTLRSRDE